MFNFNWFKKRSIKEEREEFNECKSIDNIEAALWEVKEEYDLPTEEVINVVMSKRENLNYLRKEVKKRNRTK